MADIVRSVRIDIMVNAEQALRAINRINRELSGQAVISRRVTGEITRGALSIHAAFRRVWETLTQFRFSLLSLLFGSMALNFTFGALVSNIMDLLGASEAWRVIWLEVLLDVVEPLVDILWALTDVVASLPSWMKGLIGAFIVLVAVLGQVGFAMAMFWQTMILLFGPAGIFTIAAKVVGMLAAGFKMLLGLLAGFAPAVAGLAALAYILQYVFRYGLNVHKILAMIIVDVLTLVEVVLQGLSAVINTLAGPLRWLLERFGIHVPEVNLAAPVMHMKAVVKRWAGVGGELSLLEQAQTTVNVFVDKLVGKDPETLMDELNTVVSTGIGGNFDAVGVG